VTTRTIQTPPIESPYLTADEAAEYLRYPSAHWFRIQVKRLGIPHIRRGGRMFFTKAQLDEFMGVVSEATKRPRGPKKVA
jgi:hypothetical protein